MYNSKKKKQFEIPYGKKVKVKRNIIHVCEWTSTTNYRQTDRLTTISGNQISKWKHVNGISLFS